MSRFAQDFFWTPAETSLWIRHIMSARRLWAVLWKIGKDVSLLAVDDIQPDIFVSTKEDAVQIFLGASEIVEGPAWRELGGRRLIDFRKSYAVQVVPPIVVPFHRILLQGRMAILRRDEYEDSEKADDLVALFRHLRRDMADFSDQSRKAIQLLPDGKVKVWKDILLGKGVSDDGSVQLKQFIEGQVFFQIAPASGKPSMRH